MDLRETFATNLRRLRHAAGLSQDDLAYEAEVSRSYLSQLEKGTHYVSLRVIGRLAEVHKALCDAFVLSGGCRREQEAKSVVIPVVDSHLL